MEVLFQKLEETNCLLESSPHLNRQALLDMGIIEESEEPVCRVGSKNGEQQKLPFKRLHLPIAHTGILEPTKPVHEIHKAIQILLPGAGTTFSVAETLCDVAGTFHRRKNKNRGKGRGTQQSILNQLLPNDPSCIASFPADLPLNGMGSSASFEFASERGLVTVIRHIHLVLSHLYPNRPVFIGGRSQGGIASILYGLHYEDVAGVFAVNPPHPDPELFKFTVDYLEERAEVLSDLLHFEGVSLHKPSWKAYKTFTPHFNYPDRIPLCPTMILVSLGDTFNSFPRYADKMRELAKKDDKYQVYIMDSGHNLWDRKQEDTYLKVIEIQLQFMLQNLVNVFI